MYRLAIKSMHSILHIHSLIWSGRYDRLARLQSFTAQSFANIHARRGSMSSNMGRVQKYTYKCITLIAIYDIFLLPNTIRISSKKKSPTEISLHETFRQSSGGDWHLSQVLLRSNYICYI
jgi:hypothetical protein